MQSLFAESTERAYRMVTEIPAAILRCKNGEGCISRSGVGDLFAIKDTGDRPAERLRTLSMPNIELVIIGGRVLLASDDIVDRLPLEARNGLEPLAIDGMMRWLRAPVSDLLSEAEAVVGYEKVRLGTREIHTPAAREATHAC